MLLWECEAPHLFSLVSMSEGRDYCVQSSALCTESMLTVHKHASHLNFLRLGTFVTDIGHAY